MMIDPETRKKIVEYKKNGYTNSKIKEKTGLSLPTIRKILREEMGYAIEGSRTETLHVSHIVEDDDILIVNLTKNHPSRGYSTLQRLRNGVPTWIVSDLLGEIYPDFIVKRIVDGLNKHGGGGDVYQVNVSRDTNREVSVVPLTCGAYPMNQLVV